MHKVPTQHHAALAAQLVKLQPFETFAYYFAFAMFGLSVILEDLIWRTNSNQNRKHFSSILLSCLYVMRSPTQTPAGTYSSVLCLSPPPIWYLGSQFRTALFPSQQKRQRKSSCLLDCSLPSEEEMMKGNLILHHTTPALPETWRGGLSQLTAPHLICKSWHL